MNRLWITEPQRRTCLARVDAVRGEWFRVDRALFSPTSGACRHPQPADKGTVWLDGEKRRLAGVRADTDVWYRLRGTVPEVGLRLQCELEQVWRSRLSAAHTAMHLFLAAVDEPLASDPEVRGGGHARLTFATRVAPKQLAAWLSAAKQAAARDEPVTSEFVSKTEAQRRATPQRFQVPDPVPGPDPCPLVQIGDVCYPCDGTHVDRTGRIGDMVVSHAAMGKDGFVVGLRATADA